jgi:hypothetical protein
MPVTGGTPRETFRFQHFGYDWITLAFSADGRSLLVPRKVEANPEDPYWTLLRVPVKGGKAQDLGIKMVGFDKVTADPNGEQILFSSRGPEQKGDEVWVIDNFLPDQVARQ